MDCGLIVAFWDVFNKGFIYVFVLYNIDKALYCVSETLTSFLVT